jgi:hypothetical protein
MYPFADHDLDQVGALVEHDHLDQLSVLRAQLDFLVHGREV